MKEQWIKWNYLNHLSGNYIVHSLNKEWIAYQQTNNHLQESSAKGCNHPREKQWESSLTIALIETITNQKKINLIYPTWFIIYRKVNINERKKLLLSLTDFYGPDFYINWPLFQVLDSSYVTYLVEDVACGIRGEIEEYKHHVIITKNEVIDIISTIEPILKLHNI